MLTLSEYLVQREARHLIKLLIALIVGATGIIVLWATPLLQTRLFSEIPNKILWSALVVLFLSILILLSYIKYVYCEDTVKIILNKYKQHDERFGIPIHKKIENFKMCPNCLLKSKIEYKVKEYVSYCHCTACGQKYYAEEDDLTAYSSTSNHDPGGW